MASTEADGVAQHEPQTFTEGILGPGYDRPAWARRWRALSPPARVAWATGLFAALLFVPYAGAVGLWDPW